MEEIMNCRSYEDARNRAIAWLESLGGPIGAHYEVEIGRLGLATGLEVGVSSTIDPYRRLRIDYDPAKGPHFNAEVFKGSGRKKHAFTFPGDEQTIATLLKSRLPR